ncbi:hypothetical protein P7B02_03765 [Caulobacter segnis]|uniref:hypothetical protein n=1 Tax=Caulobacter segnis TaxID=88688 RepID=UPI00240EF59E|nr:hypothetical protein [Caulobacter segnis]MDG2520649.1 hypothetical protein [Caulobacter segnis]
MSFITWEMAFPIGVILLGLALAWGLLRYKSRNKAIDRVSEDATRAQYADPESYGRKEQGFREQLKD